MKLIHNLFNQIATAGMDTDAFRTLLLKNEWKMLHECHGVSIYKSPDDPVVAHVQIPANPGFAVYAEYAYRHHSPYMQQVYSHSFFEDGGHGALLEKLFDVAPVRQLTKDNRKLYFTASAIFNHLVYQTDQIQEQTLKSFYGTMKRTDPDFFKAYKVLQKTALRLATEMPNNFSPFIQNNLMVRTTKEGRQCLVLSDPFLEFDINSNINSKAGNIIDLSTRTLPNYAEKEIKIIESALRSPG